MTEFSHIRGDHVHMVDVSGKGEVMREATAKGRIYLRPRTMKAIREGTVIKGNVLATARIAAIGAVKETSHLIPMCHPIPLGGIDVEFTEEDAWIEVSVRVRSMGRTGVEMEALTGVAMGLLTVWDMVKSAEKDEGGQYPHTRIDGIMVVEKRKEGPEDHRSD